MSREIVKLKFPYYKEYIEPTLDEETKEKKRLFADDIK